MEKAFGDFVLCVVASAGILMLAIGIINLSQALTIPGSILIGATLIAGWSSHK